MRLLGAAVTAALVVAVLIATGPAGRASSPAAGAEALPGGGWAVPLRAPRPAWVTDALLARAAAAPVPAPAAASEAAAGSDLPLSGYVGIRPGSQMVSPSLCTMNFVFQRGGELAIGTAGHCVESVGQEVTVLTVAPASDELVLVTIGTVLSRVQEGVGADFALVGVRPELHGWVFPTIAQVGGPCGAYTGEGLTAAQVPLGQHADLEAGEQLFHYGHGVGVGAGGTARTGHALYWEPGAFWWAGGGTPGDSGSPVRVGTSGLGAAGVVSHLVVNSTHLGATVVGTRITAISSLVPGYALVSSPHCG